MSDKELKLCMQCMSELGEDGVCSVCGSSGEVAHNDAYLMMGSLLNMRYLSGASDKQEDGIVHYIGYDIFEKRKVEICEFFPEDCAQRDIYSSDVHFKEGKEEEYSSRLAEFEEKCRKIKGASADSTVVLKEIFKENNTVYAIFDTVSQEARLETGAEINKAEGQKAQEQQEVTNGLVDEKESTKEKALEGMAVTLSLDDKANEDRALEESEKKEKNESKKEVQAKYISVYKNGEEQSVLEIPMKKRTRRGTAYGFIALIIALAALICVAGGYMYNEYMKQREGIIINPNEMSGIDLDEMAQKTAVVQDFVGQYYAFIEDNIDYRERYNITVEYDYSGEYEENYIFAQSVAPGTSLGKGKIDIVLYISKGPRSIAMPDVLGRDIAYAESILREKNIEYKIFDVFDESTAYDIVIRTSKQAGESIDIEKDMVALYVRRSGN